MAINFRKLNKQIKPFKPESKKGYIFIATEEQVNNCIFSVAVEGSKRNAMRCLKNLIAGDKLFREEFTI